MGFKQVFDSLTVKHMHALRKQIQSLTDFALNTVFGPMQCKGILRRIARNIYFRGRIWFALISTRVMTLDKLLLPPSSSFLQYK